MDPYSDYQLVRLLWVLLLNNMRFATKCIVVQSFPRWW